MRLPILCPCQLERHHPAVKRSKYQCKTSSNTGLFMLNTIVMDGILARLQTLL